MTGNPTDPIDPSDPNPPELVFEPVVRELPDQRPLVTMVLLLVNLLFAAAVTVDERVLDHPFGLIDFGAKHRLLIQSGQHWRLITAAFLHQGFLHLAVNMYALWVLGRFCEPIYGRVR